MFWMNRDDALEQFYMDQTWNGIERIVELDLFCRNNKDSFGERLGSAFQKLAMQIKAKQQIKEKEDIYCISICFLRSKYYIREGNIRIFALDKRFFLDQEPIWVEMDCSDLSYYLWGLEDDIFSFLKEYKNEIVKSDVHKLIQTEYIPMLIGYLTELARYTVRKGCHYFDEISVTDDFCITVGEYQGEYDEIFVTEKMDTKGVKLERFLNIHKAEKFMFCCKRYFNQQVKDMDLRGINFTKSCFEKVNICNSSLENSILLKTTWLDCKLTDISWKEAQLFDAAFIGSELTGSDFSGIIAPVIPANLLVSATLSWRGVDFTNTNLTNVKFAGADIRGADFRGAKFCDTDFKDALLDKTVFNREARAEVDFSEEQRSQIIFID